MDKEDKMKKGYKLCMGKYEPQGEIIHRYSLFDKTRITSSILKYKCPNCGNKTRRDFINEKRFKRKNKPGYFQFRQYCTKHIMNTPFCENCENVINEDEKHHHYEEDGIYVCDDCHKYIQHDIGRTG